MMDGTVRKRLLLCMAISLILICASSFVSYKLGHWRGWNEGWSEGERISISRELRKKTEALRLVRSGQMEAGLQFLDHTLDENVLIAAGRSPHCCAPQLNLSREQVLYYLKPVITYRSQFPRLPYTCDGCVRFNEAADEIVREYARE